MNHFISSHSAKFTKWCQFVYSINNWCAFKWGFPKNDAENIRDFHFPSTTIRPRYFLRLFPHRSNVFIYLFLFNPLGTRFYLATDKRECLVVIFLKLLIITKRDYLWDNFLLLSKKERVAKISIITENHRVAKEKIFISHAHVGRAERRRKQQLRVIVDNANINTKSENFSFWWKEVSYVFFRPSFSLNFHSQIYFNSVNYSNLNISDRSRVCWARTERRTD